PSRLPALAVRLDRRGGAGPLLPAGGDQPEHQQARASNAHDLSRKNRVAACVRRSGERQHSAPRLLHTTSPAPGASQVTNVARDGSIDDERVRRRAGPPGQGGRSAGVRRAHHPSPCRTGTLRAAPARESGGGDRKSTRLNSSHVKISYAVFCLKKKKI